MTATELYPVTLRYFAAARAAAGCSDEVIDATSVADAVAQAGARHGQGLAQVLAACSLLLDGRRLDAAAQAEPLIAPAEVEALPPFAGG